MQLAGIHCFCRMFIWRSLLKLPENHAAYSSLVDKGTHTAFARLHEEYPIKSRKLLRVLQRFVLISNDLHKPHTLESLIFVRDCRASKICEYASRSAAAKR